MKKKASIIIVAVLLLIIFSGVVPGWIGRRPFKNLLTAHIESAVVHLAPPDVTVPIVERKELVEYLEDVVIYNEDNTYTEYSGQAVVFILTMTDGSQIEVMAYNPFLVIDGVGYRTKYEPCEALNRYANRLLDES